MDPKNIEGFLEKIRAKSDSVTVEARLAEDALAVQIFLRHQGYKNDAFTKTMRLQLTDAYLKEAKNLSPQGNAEESARARCLGFEGMTQVITIRFYKKSPDSGKTNR